MKQGGFSRRARLYDRLGRVVIATGGVGIIAAVLGIFVFIGRETAPLFRPAHLESRGAWSLAGDETDVFVAGTDPFREIAFGVGPAGFRFLRISPETAASGSPTSPIAAAPVPVSGLDLGGARVTAADRSPGDGRVALGLSDGRVLAVRVEFELSYDGGGRVVTPVVHLEDAASLLAGPPAAVAYRHDGDRRWAVVALGDAGEVVVRVAERQRSLMGGGRVQATVHELTDRVPAAVTSVALDGAVRQLVLGTRDGMVQVYRLGEASQSPDLVETFDAGAGVTALAFLLGDLSLAVGDAEGAVSTWFRVADEGAGARRYRRIHVLEPHAAAVRAIAPSERDKQFLTGDEAGEVSLHHATSERTLHRQELPGGAVRHLTFAPKADGFLAVLGRDTVLEYDVDNPHPEVTWGTLFDKIWYEGYDEPRYVWQSTGGTDEFEPKLSLVPLVFGTIKATLYAMLFALPMAVLAAIYTAEFASPGVRTAVKPTVEIMASLPSVILGFLAGLWLAPLLEKHVIGTAMGLLLTPVIVVAGSLAWRQLPRGARRYLPRNAELVALVLLTLFGAAIGLRLGPAIEGALFGDGLPRWLSTETSLRYDQRNCIVIGFAMGFAVIPLIFTICEDALSSVPASLKAGSLALGATRWQTAVRVVLPMALPGVFSAAMIGFGRAVGETMIVLMATGNTPIMDWNIFTGMRTISANIAVELPEAPHQGTLYRVLFLSGLLLFMVTFAVNTLAEGVRQRLREKYRRV